AMRGGPVRRCAISGIYCNAIASHPNSPPLHSVVTPCTVGRQCDLTPPRRRDIVVKSWYRRLNMANINRTFELDTAFFVNPIDPDSWPASFVPMDRPIFVKWKDVSTISVPTGYRNAAKEIPTALITLNNGLAI